MKIKWLSINNYLSLTLYVAAIQIETIKHRILQHPLELFSTSGTVKIRTKTSSWDMNKATMKEWKKAIWKEFAPVFRKVTDKQTMKCEKNWPC